MTGQFDAELLDDPDRLAAADSGGLLRAAATAGAQVRSTAEVAADAGLDRLGGQRPRALVLLTRPGAAAAAAPLLTALLGGSCPVPVLATRSVPAWIGPLDVVLAQTSDPGDRELAEGLDRAGRRGARTVLSAPGEGPVAAAAAGHALLLTPRIEIPAGLALPRALTAGLLLCSSLDLLQVDPEPLAAELDREAERDRPDRDTQANPAKAFALRMADRTPLLWGTDAVATAVAGHAATTLAAHAGIVAHAAGYPEAAALPALRAEATRALGDRAVFHDPYLDPAESPGTVRPFLFGVLDDAHAAELRAAAERLLPGIELFGAGEDLLVSSTDPAAAARTAAILALRADLAALYLGLGRHAFAAANVGPEKDGPEKDELE